ncbi:hypothetical protein PIB30_019137 [Stylosanthes scabra]|uniref:RNase H type-1 domain-containing protein n=1 Tax=Stylosanthes scabra TaxID=79078 RepID=A0ABU6X6E6_9FABA|nr:hypothetical protein [Stylosanthes scabra]
MAIGLGVALVVFRIRVFFVVNFLLFGKTILLGSLVLARDLASKIKEVELWPWCLRIKLIQRSANMASDLLAKHAASSQLVYTE